MNNSKNIDEVEKNIISILQKNPEGLRLFQIAELLKVKTVTTAVRRSLQRKLKSLTNKGAITISGNARARSYRLFDDSIEKSESVSEKKPISANGLNLSASAEKLFHKVSLSLTARKPVGFESSFLRDYSPNKTFYLSATERKELLSLGHVETVKRPAGTYARDIYSRLLVELSWNSSRLEGNTYSLLDTKRLIELGEAAEGKNTTEAQMILNHKSAIEFMIDSATEIDFDRLTICNLHALLSDNLLGDPGASGKLRDRAVRISGCAYIPIDNPYLLKENFEVFLKKCRAIKDPFEQCFFTLVHLSYLQAFEDVNKRTSRLAANIPLFKENLKPLSFVDVSQDIYLKSLLAIYELNDVTLMKELFMWAYKRSAQRYSAIQQSLGEPNLFKLKHRELIQKVIQNVVKSKVRSKSMVKVLQKAVSHLQLEKSEAKKMFEILEQEIIHLHEGNIARYKINLSEYRAWIKLK